MEPNTPVEVRQGVLAFAQPDAEVDAELHAELRELFGRVGTVVEVPEPLMRVAGATSGVGPAYWALLVEAQVDAAIRRGMPPARRRRRWSPRRWPAPPRCCARGRTTRWRCAAPSPRPAARPPAGSRRSSAAASAPPSRRPWTTRWTREGREEIADFLGALITVYVIVIIAWVVISFVFAMGVRVPYSRWSNAVLDFLRDIANPWLNLFRRLPLRVGPLDLSPIVAILVLQIVGGIIVEPDPAVTPRQGHARRVRDGRWR